jgi:hypothetical protein
MRGLAIFFGVAFFSYNVGPAVRLPFSQLWTASLQFDVMIVDDEGTLCTVPTVCASAF